MDGIIILDKPAGMSSFACCAAARRTLGERRIGHAGTLDPMATGVLPLLVGRATRALALLPSHDKRYEATVRFGYTSDTLDVWGQVTPTGGALPARAAVEAALAAFRGEILQVPPMVSALKRDGVRLYELARQGVEVPRAARAVTVYALELLDYDPAAGEARLDCRCSAGTYIRVIADDLGRALGCGGVMSALRRTEAAGFTLADGVPPEEALPSRVRPVDTALTAYPAVSVSAAQAVRFCNGGALDLARLTLPAETGALMRVYGASGSFLGVGRVAEGELRVERVLG